MAERRSFMILGTIAGLIGLAGACLGYADGAVVAFAGGALFGKGHG